MALTVTLTITLTVTGTLTLDLNLALICTLARPRPRPYLLGQWYPIYVTGTAISCSRRSWGDYTGKGSIPQDRDCMGKSSIPQDRDYMDKGWIPQGRGYTVEGLLPHRVPVKVVLRWDRPFCRGRWRYLQKGLYVPRASHRQPSGRVPGSLLRIISI